MCSVRLTGIRKMNSTTKTRLLILLSLLFLLISCSETDDEKGTGGVIFSFDDRFINEWVSQRDLFKKYSIKATFFVSRPYLLEPAHIEDLRLLNSDGHEIGCHGMYHLDATEYADSIDRYIDYEILPALDLLSDFGFQIRSFAYPYGKSTANIDAAMLEHFTYLRKATMNYNYTTLDTYDEIYASLDSHNVVNSMGIDKIFDISQDNLENGIYRASNRDEVLVLYAHCIDTLAGDYHIDPEYLENAFKLISKYDIRSLRMSDLNEYFKR
jgi:peptidoglycan/xylan/chitin deacetylase (PgdA/CDA1 family)